MSANEQAGSEATTQQDGQQQIQVQVSPDLDYSYRDFFSIYVGAEDVVLEFGNRHRAQANRASVQTRLVLSIQNAFRLQQALGRSLEEARKRIQEARAQANAGGEGDGAAASN